MMRFSWFGAALVVCAVSLAADEPSERHQLAASLLDAMNMEAQINASIEDAKSALPAQVKQMNQMIPSLGPKTDPAAEHQKHKEMMEKVMELCAEEMKWEKVKGDYINLYAQTFSAEELKGLIAFYKSAVGKSLVAKQPEINRKLTEMSQESMMRLMPRIMATTGLFEPVKLERPKPIDLDSLEAEGEPLQPEPGVGADSR